MTANSIEITGRPRPHHPTGKRIDGPSTGWRSWLVGSAILCSIAACSVNASAAEAGATPTTGNPPCTQRLPGLGKQEFECRLQPSASTQHFRFKVDFSGSHDDTRAALEATLDGAPFDCADGSKTNTESEDGEVSLDCRFTVAANPAAPAELLVAVRWYHAQYMGYTLSTD